MDDFPLEESADECVLRTIPSYLSHEERSVSGLERKLSECRESMRTPLQLSLENHEARRDFLKAVLALPNNTNLLKARRILMDPYLDPYQTP